MKKMSLVQLFGCMCAVVAVSLLSACGGGGGGATGGAIPKASLVGTWRVESITANGQTVGCPGNISTSSTHTIECSGGSIKLGSSGNYTMSTDILDQGTWNYSSGALVLTSTEGNGTLQFTVKSADSQNLSLTATDNQNIVVETKLAKLDLNLTNERIAFQSNRDGDPDIYLMKPDGSNVVELTDNTTNDLTPAISPDGSMVAYEKFVQGSGGIQNSDGIYVMDADGINGHKVSDARPSYWMEWSPDGSKIAFAGYATGSSTPGIFWMNADGSNLTNVSGSIPSPASPTWSPDSTKLAFSSSTFPSPQVYVVAVMGGAPVLIQDNADNPSWSPVGNKIAFTKSLYSEIWVMNPDGSSPQMIAQGLDAEVKISWGLDGQNVFFDSYGGGVTVGKGICRLNVVTGNVVNITQFADEHPTVSRR